MAAARGERLFCCFVDLEKAYDRVPRANLFFVLARELGVSLSTVKCLYRMYAEVRASVWVSSEYTVPFGMAEGVR